MEILKKLKFHRNNWNHFTCRSSNRVRLPTKSHQISSTPLAKFLWCTVFSANPNQPYATEFYERSRACLMCNLQRRVCRHIGVRENSSYSVDAAQGNWRIDELVGGRGAGDKYSTLSPKKKYPFRIPTVHSKRIDMSVTLF